MPGFPTHIRAQALVLSARHCCVCHRYMALGVEIHHIEPRSEGGSDLLDNAIVLCFDCHAAAGHYNSKHPKGTKYSRTELLQQRDAWYEIVQRGPIKTPASTDEMSVITRYVMTEDATALNDVLNVRDDELPFGKFNLLQLKKLLAQIERCSSAEGLSIEEGLSYGQVFKSAEDLKTARPSYEGRDWRQLESIDESRLPEFWKQVLAGGASVSDLGYARPCAFACGAGTPNGWWEEITLRRPRAVFLQVLNKNSYPIRVSFIRMNERGQNRPNEFLPYSELKTEAREFPLSSIAIASEESLLIPVGVLYGPLKSDDLPVESSRVLNQSSGDERREYFRTESTVFDSKLEATFARYGYWMSVVGLGVALQSGAIEIPVHDFDPTKPFTALSTQWEIGSCPHIFWLTAKNDWLYGGEILDGANESGLCATTSCIAPSDVTGFQVCELEYEITKLDWVEVDDVRLAEGVVLTKGDSIFFPVQSGSRVNVRGHYVAAIDKPSTQDHIRQKRGLLDAVMTQMSSSYWTLEESPRWR
ncbi:MAG: HNH endonuclease [Parvibaculaceae bacterium]